GSAIGTFLNEVRLPANRPAPVVSGDQFAIFPYTFTLEIKERWSCGAPVDVYAGLLTPVNSPAFQNTRAADQALFEIRVEPVGAVLLLEVSRVFLERLLAFLLAPLCADLPER